MNNNNRDTRIKRNRVNRTVYVTAVTILVATAILVGVSNMTQRRSKPVEDSTATETTAQTPAIKSKDAETTAPVVEKPIKKNGGNAAADTPSAVTGENEADVPADGEAVTSDDAAEVAGAAEAEALPIFAAPVSGIVSMPHSDSVLVYSVTMNDYRTHCGVDIETEIGQPVYAAADGIIGDVWSDPMMGECVSVEHSGGAVTVYKNLMESSAANLASGMAVMQGETIGAAGESAIIEIASEPHLHFELKIDGIDVDPSDYIDFGSQK